MKKRMSYLIIALILVGFSTQGALAQSEEPFELGLSRDFGYGGLGNDIQGLFSFKIRGPENLQRVEFMIDGEMIGEDTEAPFKLQFSTDDYPLGEHSLSAVGYTSDGRELQSNVIVVEFVSPDEGMKFVGKILVPMLILVGIALVGSFTVPLLTAKKRGSLPLGEPRKYGIAGGAICPRCQRPFSLNFMAPNMLVGKFDRCPHCGKWAIMRARPINDLRAAEAAELEMAKTQGLVTEETEADKLRKDLENSRYQDL
ncbi:MAG: hypothetical protein JW726_16880 [Anaerolineales bacterium]|nr:hypothetical protein [Anaerolineales bacterium]